ncbi:unnamed protein product, partial [Gongylonema pulchrum]|uniref:RIG-I_C domain-containing protein n=1 Tax=Gongylonema pulchrum TaxID=637853 RepID=A0A183EJA3_9BILA
MIALCARLSAHSISTVRTQIENLRFYVKPPIDEIRQVHRPQHDRFVYALQHCMSRIEAVVKGEVEELVNNDVITLQQHETTFPTMQNSSRYESFIGVLRSRLSEMPGGLLKQQLLKMLEHLRFYYRALFLSDLLPNWFAYCYLCGRMIDDEATAIQSQLCTLFSQYVKPEADCLSPRDT